MSSESQQQDSSKSSNSYVTEAKDNIDKLERQLDEATKENEKLNQKVSEQERKITALEKDVTDYDVRSGDLLSEIEDLKSEKAALEDKNDRVRLWNFRLRAQVKRRGNIAKALEAQKQKNAAQAKVLEIAKRMRDFSECTTFRTWVDVQT